MNYTELIHDLLDGTLEQKHEESLFLALASNEELRSELKQFVQLDISARRDNEAYQPDPDSQDKIFAALGIPSATVAGASAVAISASTIPLWNKLYMNLFVGIGSAILGAILMFWWNSPKNTTQGLASNSGIYNGHNTGNSIQSLMGFVNSNSVPIMTSTLRDTIVESRTVVKFVDGPERIIYVSSIDSTKQIESGILGTSNKSSLSKKLDNYTDLEEYRPIWTNKIVGDDNLSLGSNINPEYQFLSNYIHLSDLFEKFSIELRGNEDWSIPVAKINRSSFPVFNNTNASLMYEFTDNLKIGIEVRQEYFYQEYNGVGSDNLGYNYMQYTNYISAGLLARYDWINIGNAQLFIQPGIAINEVGPIARAMIGAEYQLVDRVSLMLGLEGSILQYSHQGNNFYTQKIGLHYGINIQP